MALAAAVAVALASPLTQEEESALRDSMEIKVGSYPVIDSIPRRHTTTGATGVNH